MAQTPSPSHWGKRQSLDCFATNYSAERGSCFSVTLTRRYQASQSAVVVVKMTDMMNVI